VYTVHVLLLIEIIDSVRCRVQGQREYQEDSKEGNKRHQRRLTKQHSEMAELSSITINNVPSDNVDTFKYLGRPLTATSTNITAVNTNLQKSRKNWGRVANILKREGAGWKTMANF
jgi:hypothetical protein